MNSRRNNWSDIRLVTSSSSSKVTSILMFFMFTGSSRVSQRFTAWIAIRDGRDGEHRLRLERGQRHRERGSGEHERHQAQAVRQRKNRNCRIEKQGDREETH